MSDLKTRIEEIQQKMEWDDKAMGDVAGVSRSAVAQWRGQESKIIQTIGNIEVALNLSQATGYSALWIAKGKSAKTIEGSGLHASWPFTSIDERKVRNLNDAQRASLETAILVAAGYAGLDINKP